MRNPIDSIEAHCLPHPTPNATILLWGICLPAICPSLLLKPIKKKICIGV